MPRDPGPTPIILDTDMHTDCDDVGALAMLHALADLGEARILGVIHNAPTDWGPPCIDAINSYYGRPVIPIGFIQWADFESDPAYAKYRTSQAHIEKQGKDYVEAVAKAFPRAGAPPEAAVALYRRLLARADDHSVVVCAVGPLNALAALLDAPPGDGIPLSGAALVAKKVRLLVTMGGGVFPEGRDGFNWDCDRSAAARVLNHWPTAIAVSPHGADVLTGHRVVTNTPETNPVRRAYEIYVKESVKKRSSWDQVALLYAVRGAGDCFQLRPGHRIHYDPDSGRHEWRRDAEVQQVCVDLATDTATLASRLEDLMAAPPQRSP